MNKTTRWVNVIDFFWEGQRRDRNHGFWRSKVGGKVALSGRIFDMATQCMEIVEHATSQGERYIH